MKEIKTSRMEVRLTDKEKEQIKEYCKAHRITISEFVKMACSNIMNNQKENN